MKKKIIGVVALSAFVVLSTVAVTRLFEEKKSVELTAGETENKLPENNALLEAENVAYSRELSEAEVSRRVKLSYEYEYNGKRPQKPLSERTKVDELYFDGESNTVVLPERELTDEELLALTDYYACVNSLYEKNKAQPKNTAVTEEEAVELAKAELGTFFNEAFTSDNYNADCAYNESEQQNESYERGRNRFSVTLSPVNMPYLDEAGIEYRVYFADIDSENGQILSVSVYDNKLKEKTKATDGITEEEKESFKKASAVAMSEVTELDTDTEPFVSDIGKVSVYSEVAGKSAVYRVELSYPDMSRLGWEIMEVK
jgi:hypothetical protein